jgi:hypothetical protein
MIPNLPKRDEWVANFAKRQPGAETDHVTLNECDVCGYLEWASSTKAPQPKVTVQSMERATCPRCTAIAMRSPELFGWVLSVLVKHEQGGGHSNG